MDIREAIDESVRLSEINKNLVKELKKAVGVVDSQQREIHRLQAINHQNMVYLIEIGKENRVLSKKKHICMCNKPEIKPEKLKDDFDRAVELLKQGIKMVEGFNYFIEIDSEEYSFANNAVDFLSSMEEEKSE